ncbi:MAG TPA: AMP-binding protein, partial [Dehalococcoidia bacterium]|nr:AMP-binding protein [Dehalococcoidia bacterium]
MNTFEFLQISAMTVPDREALVCNGTRRTYAETLQRVIRLANALRELGVGPRTTVAVMSTNSAEYVEVYYATAKLGATFVPLNYRAKDEELTYMVNVTEPKVLFVGERYLDLVGRLRGAFTSEPTYICFERSQEGMRDYASLLASGSDEDFYVEIDENDP